MMINRGNTAQMIDLKTVPFSRFGSYFVVSSYESVKSNEVIEKLYIRDIHGGDEDPGLLFEIELDKEYDLITSETELILKNNNSEISICMATQTQLMIKTTACSVKLNYKLKKYDHIHEKSENLHEITSYSKERRYGIKTLRGSLDIDSPWQEIGNEHIKLTLSKDTEILIEGYKVIEEENKKYSNLLKSYDDGLLNVKDDYEKWIEQSSDKSISKSSQLAHYILWMNFVRPDGLIKKPAMYMSNNWMTNIWSWDNCFGAIYLSKDYPELAWDQYTMFFDHQHETGCYPDFINDTIVSYSAVKPPIYGWAYNYMMRRNPLFNSIDKIKDVFDSVSKATEFWLNHRMKDGLPYYTHGNDSGWDNGTFYMKGMPMSTPDLVALLSSQMKFLSECADKLYKDNKEDHYLVKKKYWLNESTNMINKLMSNMWQENKFYPLHLPSNSLLKEGDSLQAYLPIMIGEDLEASVVNKLVTDIMDENRFNSQCGLATESLSSDYYREDGYWRGPIWAPTMLMFIDGLKNSGYVKEAEDIASKYMKTLEKGGMAENHDPLTGAGLVDPAFAWTSSVYLILRQEYNRSLND